MSFFFSRSDFSTVLMTITTIFYPFKRKTYWKYFNVGFNFLFLLKRKEIKTWNLGCPTSFFVIQQLYREMCQFGNIFRRYSNLKLEQKFRPSSMTLTALTVFFCANTFMNTNTPLYHHSIGFLITARATIAIVAIEKIASEKFHWKQALSQQLRPIMYYECKLWLNLLILPISIFVNA